MKTVKEDTGSAGLNSETASNSPLQARRPRRNVLHKNVGFHDGLLWTEEKELKKALYASLQDTKKSRFDESEGGICVPVSMDEIANLKKRKNDAFANGFSEENQNANPKKTKVHAQRKFAQGSNPTSPSVTPVKFKNSVTPSMDLLPVKRPKTEDFLTFLCLRGTSILPSSLDYFNVASKNDLHCDIRCSSPVNGDSAERVKSHPKLPGAKGAMKARGRPLSDKSIKSQPSPKPSIVGEDLTSSSESSLSDAEESLNKKSDKAKPVIFDATRKKSVELDNHVDKNQWLNHSGLLPQLGAIAGEAKPDTCVQALKQKYRQQRLAKQKEALVKAKKTDVAGKKDSKDVKDSKIEHVERPTRVQQPRLHSQSAAASNSTPSKASSVVKNKGTRREKKSTNVTKKGAHSKVYSNSKMVEAANKHKPVTRHAAMLLQAAREREEKRNQTNKRPIPPHSSQKKLSAKAELVPVLSKIEKNIPQLASEHSYVKRLPASKESSPKPSKPVAGAARQDFLSDFSSDDDEPLVKKQKSANLGLDGKSGTRRPKMHATPALEVEVPKTATGRPSRKTKEAATAYLELLGQKLYSQDDDFEMPEIWKRKLSPPKANPKKPTQAAKKSSSDVKGVTRAKSLDTSASSTASSIDAKESPPHMATRKSQKCPASKLPVRADTIKTRDYMKKLSEAQFKLDKAQGKKGGISRLRNEALGQAIKRHHQVKAPEQALEARISKTKNPDADIVGGKSKDRTRCEKVVPARRPVAKKMGFGPVDANKVKSAAKKVCPDLQDANKSRPAARKLCPGPPDANKIRPVAKKTCSAGPWDATRLRPHKDKKRKKKKRALNRGRHSSGSSSSSYSMPVPAKRGPGRVPASHALRRYPTSSSDTSTTSESSFDYPSKPESTTISVRQNVASTSVAVQVNLLNDISDLDDDFWEPGFLDADIEGLFALDRVITPTLCKGSSPSRSLPRSSWEADGASSSGKTGTLTPTKRMTPTSEKSDSTPGTKSKAAALKALTKGSPSSSPFHLRRSSPTGKPSKPDSSDDDSSQFLIPLLTSSGVKDAPIFYPTAEEFQDPFQYIEKVRPVAERFGVCKIIPPPSFKPDCKVNDDMRFTAHNQYVHKMLHRWGPNVQQLAAIRKHLEDQGVECDMLPLIGGMELDLPRLFQTVQKYGGLKEVIEKQRWQKVAETMKIGKSAQDRVTKLYDAYCKYLLPYDTLSKEEKGKLEQQVLAEKQRKKGRFADSEECVTKGRSMSLSSFYRIARNTMAMWFKTDPKPTEVEQEYWRIVNQKQQHVCVNAGNIDSSTYGYGFSCSKSSPFAKHQWNLKVLTNNASSVLRCMGPVMGVTIPTLHVGMLFTTGCWYRDPHCLPWIEYLHTGASKIWYGIPASQSWKFRDAMSKIVPDFCADTPIWLPSDTAMVPPNLLVENGVSLCRLVQNSGQFVVVFPRAFTSTICCGYTISESVYFSGADWLEIAPIAFKEIADSREPAVFSLQRLLFSIANDGRVSIEVLQQILPLIEEIRDKELSLRKQLYELGLKQSEHLPMLELKDARKRWAHGPESEDLECEICRANCYISMVVNIPEKTIFCLHHAMEQLQKRKKDVKCWKLLYKYDQAELNELVGRTREQIQVHSAKKKIAKKTPKTLP